MSFYIKILIHRRLLTAFFLLLSSFAMLMPQSHAATSICPPDDSITLPSLDDNLQVTLPQVVYDSKGKLLNISFSLLYLAERAPALLFKITNLLVNCVLEDTSNYATMPRLSRDLQLHIPQLLDKRTGGIQGYYEAKLSSNGLGSDIEGLILDVSNVVVHKANVTGSLPDLISFSFNMQQTAVLPGKSTVAGEGFGCKGIVAAADQIGLFGLMSQFYQNGCYTDGRYNHNDFKVEHGTLVDSNRKFSLDAYTVYEPTHKASEFLASRHAVYYNFPTKTDYVVYRYSSGILSKIAEIPATQITPNTFIPVAELQVSDLTDNVTYVFATTTQQISAFTPLGDGIEGARLRTTALGDVLQYSYQIKGTPFDTRLDYNNGPDSHANIYSLTRQFFLVYDSGQLGIVWQDKATSKIYLTWLGQDLKSRNTVSLSNANDYDLAAVAYDNNGHIYYLSIQSGNGVKEGEVARGANLYKANAQGNNLRIQSLDTSKSGMNITIFGNQNVASLHYFNGQLGLIVSRTMHKSSDGLNHQGAISLVFDAENITQLKNHGQTSGHSFESLLTHNSQGEFLGIDLGDNYPRGINLHTFTANKDTSRVVYTFKTRHGTKATSPAGASYPVYSEISGGSETFYQWSNDNRTYTELGGVIQSQQGYSVIFAGEPDSQASALNNARTDSNLVDARNIGIVQVVNDIASTSSNGTEINDELIISKGNTETGGYYTFGGKFAKQRNTGVVWLTNYNDKNQNNVSRLKTVKLADNNLLLLWEIWTPNSYVNTYAMKISPSGKKLSEIVELGTQVRLNRRDDILVIDNKVYFVAGDKNEQKLILFVLQL